MPSKDLHSQPFDDTTLVKLRLFKEYAKAWLPTFIMPAYKDIYIFDFFAGPGHDENGVEGSPILILREVLGQAKNILKMGTILHLVFNEYSRSKAGCLREALENLRSKEKLLSQLIDSRVLRIELRSGEVEKAFYEFYPQMKLCPSLVYMDQNGVKFLTRQYLDAFSQCEKIDALYFNSSSFYRRFPEEKGFEDNTLGIDAIKIRNAPIDMAHEIFVEELRSVYPSQRGLKFYPFSLRKRNTGNVYGIVFCAKHLRAIDKFLTVAWRINDENGCANYDIEKQKQLTLFKENLTKIEKFEIELEAKICSGEIKNNKDALIFAYECGHPSKHAAECVKKMKNRGMITIEGNFPRVSYDAVCREKYIVEFKVSKQSER